GVGELGNRLRRDEARRLDLAQARGDEAFDQATLRLQGDRRRLVLEAVPRPDLVDPDAVSHAWASDERRIHRPLDGGDVDLDALDLEGGLGALPALEGSRVATPPGRLVEGDQGGAVVGE